LLEKSSFILKKQIIITKSLKTKKTSKNPSGLKFIKKKENGYFLNNHFPLLEQLKTLLLESELVTVPDLPARFKPAGKIKLFVTAGIFMRDEDRSLDLLIVGEKLDSLFVQKTINTLESEIGRELLCTESEMSGLFNWAMEGLTRLLNNGEFSDTKTADDIKIIMMMNASSIARFVANRVEKCKDGEITKDALYDSYSAFCEENNLPTATKDLVGKTFSRYAGFASDGQSGNYGRGMVRVWRGIKLKDTPFEITSDLIADKEFEEI
jgi:hypothetical protein